MNSPLAGVAEGPAKAERGYYRRGWDHLRPPGKHRGKFFLHVRQKIVCKKRFQALIPVEILLRIADAVQPLAVLFPQMVFPVVAAEIGDFVRGNGIQAGEVADQMLRRGYLLAAQLKLIVLMGKELPYSFAVSRTGPQAGHIVQHEGDA